MFAKADLFPRFEYGKHCKEEKCSHTNNMISRYHNRVYLLLFRGIFYGKKSFCLNKEAIYAEHVCIGNRKSFFVRGLKLFSTK